MWRKRYILSSRAEYSLQQFSQYFGKSILDVGAGGSARYFKGQLGSRYKAIDISDSRNAPDYSHDFEKFPLPFEDKSFETVLCFDCLEHCDNIHALFDELVRVSSRYVIISLPNNWPGFLKSLMFGKNITHQLGYTLSSKAQAPGVRHKWWFNLEEAHEFVSGRAQQNQAKLIEVQHVFEPGISFVYFPKIYPNLLYPNRAIFEQAVARHSWIPKALLPYWLFNLIRLPLVLPFYLLDEGIKCLFWGWGSPYRYLNLFCRQYWAVIEVNQSSTSTSKN